MRLITYLRFPLSNIDFYIPDLWKRLVSVTIRCRDNRLSQESSPSMDTCLHQRSPTENLKILKHQWCRLSSNLWSAAFARSWSGALARMWVNSQLNIFIFSSLLRDIPARAARWPSTASATRRSQLRVWQTCRFPNICHLSPVELKSKRKEESWSSWGRIVTTSSQRNILEKPFASSVSFHCMGRWVGRIW